MVQNSIDRAILSQGWLDRLATPIQHSVGKVLSPGPTGSRLRNVLHGTFLGHPLHPALTDVPIGGWTAALLMDLLSYLPPTRGLAAGADASIAIGLAGTLPAAAAGLADWSYTDGHTRRVGLVHALANVTTTLIYATSLYLRLRGSRGLGRGVSLIGYGVASFGAYLGGELVYKHGLGPTPTAFEHSSERDWTDVGELSSLAPVR